MLSTVNERFLDGGRSLENQLYAALAWVFGSYWQNFKDVADDALAKYTAINILVVLLVCPPLYLMGVFVVLGEEIAWARWRLAQPRRELLSEEVIAERREFKLRRDEVQALPKMRPRALTLRSDGGRPTLTEEARGRDRRRVGQKTVDQLGKCDFWKLPFEVREKIWKYAVGGNHVHVLKRRRRWGSVYCPAQDPADPTHRDFCTRREGDGCHVVSAWPVDMKPLALLVSCRQM